MKKRRIGRLITKIIAWALLTILFLFIGTLVLFSVYRNEISEEILNRTNSLIQGKIKFESISISPFKQFPDLSISLDEVTYYENKLDTGNVVVPIGALENIYISFNLKDLKDRKFKINKILIDNGTINLIRYPDSSLNLIKGSKLIIQPERLHRRTDTVINPFASNKQPDSIQIKDISALFDEITIRNVQVNYKDRLRNKESKVSLEELNSSFVWKKDSIFLSLHINGNISKNPTLDKIQFSNSSIKINTQTYILLKDSIVVFENSNLTIDESTIHVYGGIDYKNNELNTDITFSSNDINLHFLDLIIPVNNQYKLDSGTVSFKGNLMGNILNNIPLIRTEYIVSEAAFSFIKHSKQITNLNFKGYFESGENDDFSEAWLRIDTISALIPDGYIHGKGWVKNFKAPSIEYQLGFNFNLTELNDLLDSLPLSDLSGRIIFQSAFSGYYNPNTKEMKQSYSNSSIEFDSVSGKITPEQRIDYLDGTVSGNSDTLCINNLACAVGNGDVLINGDVFNLKSLLLKNESKIKSNLHIESYRFHLIDLFKDNAAIGRGFSYPIEDIDLLVNATTSYPELSQGLAVPTIHFDIQRLNAEIVGLLPPVNIYEGQFTLGNSDSTLHLDFQNFVVDIAGGNIQADVIFAAPLNKESYVWVNGEFENINPGRIFQKNNNPIPKVLNAFINGDVETKLNLAEEKKKLFNASFAHCNNLSYYGIQDTITFEALKLNVDTIAYNTDLSKNPLASLTSNVWIDAKQINTKGFNISHMVYTINAKNGSYQIVPGAAQWLGVKGTGKYIISPFSKPATFDIAYRVEQFKAETLMKTIMQDTIMTGNLDLNFHLMFEGLTKKEISHSIRGNILLKGKELTYHGIDMDELIEKLKRSQRFSLADVGAMIVAGPVGLAITKGSDYSRLLLDNGDATQIEELYSQWQIDGGLLQAKDLAFSTSINRVAAKGWIKPLADSLDLDIAVLNSTGCSFMSQNLSGTLKKPKISELKIFSSLIAPVTNLFEEVFSPDCEPFYTGEVKHPTAVKKQ